MAPPPKSLNQDKTQESASSASDIPNTKAVGLKYTGSGAPTVTAKGQGHLAEQIIAIAKEHDIPISEDIALVEMLSQVELDQEIPEVLYEAVVQVLIFAYDLSGKSIPTTSDTPE